MDIQMSSSVAGKGVEEDLPPPPPPPDSFHPSAELSGSQDASALPLPPPKESFSKFYEQRQVNELKRLYRHMHPELRKNLEEAVTHDLAEILTPDDGNQQTSVDSDPVVPGDVQSMRWIFENWSLDSIGEHQGVKKLSEEENILSGNVKSTSLQFQNQPSIGDFLPQSTTECESDQAKGYVHTALWLFETQPLDSLNKMHQQDMDVQKAVLREPVAKGDVGGTKVLFEKYSLDEIGRCTSVEERSFLQLKSEIQESKGDVEKTVRLFQTDNLCAIRDKNGKIHEIKSICREDIQSNAVKSVRWLFETQPLDTINKDTSTMQLIRGISLEEAQKGGVKAAKWMFETQPLDTIKEQIDEADFQASTDSIEGADVTKHRLLFETQALDSLKGNETDDTEIKEDVVGGDVKSTLWLFETQPTKSAKNHLEVGRLQKVEMLEEEKGDVKQRKHIFETCSLANIAKTFSDDHTKANEMQDIVKGDVKCFKHLFETLPLDSIASPDKDVSTQQEEIIAGNVKANQHLFETTPLYAIKDSLGNFHKVTSVSREQIMSGDVKNYKWMFETKPLDQFDESPTKVALIRGITKQEVMAGNVGTAKWLFETQPIDVIHHQMNKTEKDSTEKTEVSEKGDVKKCRWLFETQPVDMLYEKTYTKQEEEQLPQADVKSYTWLFETQPLDTLKESEDQYLKVSAANQEAFFGVDVKTTKHLFETEPLISSQSTAESKRIIRYSSRVEMPSGEVSRVKEMFETKPLGNAGNASNVTLKDTADKESIQAGSVNKFTWMFENCPMDSMGNNAEGVQEVHCDRDVQAGDVSGKKFVFETYSLDQIHERAEETKSKDIYEETVIKGSVKSSTMLFETMPLYAIQDKEGDYHEVTSVKKEEIMKGDVRGAKWLFETKPLDHIKTGEEVFVIRAVTQEDIHKGDVRAARWKFETEPLDSFSDKGTLVTRSIDDILKGDVQSNKHLFESQQVSLKKYVRMVSVSDVQQGNVRTSTWLFENQPIDSLKGDSEEASNLTTVQREDIQKGDVKRCTWLFETQPIDSLKDCEAFPNQEAPEVMPQADVKSTTWLFESTPLDKFESTHSTETEIMERNVKETLIALCACSALQYDGIIIEGNEIENVKMAKYQIKNRQAPEILKQEIVGGTLGRIMQQILHRSNVENQATLVEENENGIRVSSLQLFTQTESDLQREEVRKDMSRALNILLNQNSSVKKGIVMQETESGMIKIAIYSLVQQHTHKIAQEEAVKGDVKSTIGTLLASTQEQKLSTSIKREDNEKGNVQLYTTCIEKGDLGYLKSLQEESEINLIDFSQDEIEERTCRDEEQIINHNKHDMEQSKIIVPDKVNAEIRGIKRLVTTDKLAKCPSASKGILDDIHSSCTTQFLGRPGLINSIEDNLSNEKKGGTQTCKIAIKESTKVGSEAITSRNIEKIEDKYPGTIPAKSTIPKGFAAKDTPCPILDASLIKPVIDDPVGSELQAALQSLRQATAEAESIQKQVKNKLHKSNEEIHLSTKQVSESEENGAKMSAQSSRQEGAILKQQTKSVVTHQEKHKSYSSVQKTMMSSKKVSASEAEQGQLLCDACQESKIAPGANSRVIDGVYTAKPVKNFYNPFIEADYNAMSVHEEVEPEEVVRGDVKAAIRALQSATSEEKEVEKEDVVRGNLQAALQSLEKSNINVSKGDFKAAMIYKNAGRSYSDCKQSSNDQALRKQALSMPISPSDNGFPPSSASVMENQCCLTPAKARENCTEQASDGKRTQKCLPNTPTLTHQAQNSTFSKASGTVGRSEQALATPTRGQTNKKPAIPPKPAHLIGNAGRGPFTDNRVKIAPPIASVSSPELAAISDTKSVMPSCQSKPCISAQHSKQTEGHSRNLSSSNSPMDVRENQTTELKMEKDKTPLQIAEEKYKKRKEEENKAVIHQEKELHDLGSYKNIKKVENVVKASNKENLFFPKSLCPTQEFKDNLQSGLEHSATKDEVPYNFHAAFSHFEEQCSSQTNQVCAMKKGVVVTQGTNVMPGKANVHVIETSKYKGAQETSKTLNHEKQNRLFTDTACFKQSQESDLQTLKNVGQQSLMGSLKESMPQETVHLCQVEAKKQEVIMRQKPCRESEDERRKRLSVHKDEIVKGNVKAAMDIYENLRKQEELQKILSKVEEYEEETSKVDVKSLKGLFENVPKWVVSGQDTVHQPNIKDQGELTLSEGGAKDDTENVSSVELAFGDLEKASTEIIHLKEQTLARLLDIEEAIKKALYSVSNLKSESDIAGLSGLFKESLGCTSSPSATNNIRKISIVSSKAKPEKGVQVTEGKNGDGEKLTEKHEITKQELEVHSVPQRGNSPVSPSYISIESAARKPPQLSSCSTGCGTGSYAEASQGCPANNKGGVSCEYKPNMPSSPLNQRRQKSVLELKTIPELPKVIGTTIVTEEYEEYDQFGNKIVTSKSSKTVTKKSDSKSTSTYEAVSAPTKYSVTASPLLRRHLHNIGEDYHSNGSANEAGVVFVTFGNSSPVKK
ncbi:xin actin-binding repeat-containing protein 1 [Pleurodeles waltl]|uniref:xin actin-binding repeat-containing protein 1 n=1 Tax=Pleurodeles waltl TaxID=8319 RepID=UPI0037098D34